MVTAVVYASATGFTRRYAQLLGEKTGLPVYELGKGDLPIPGTEVIYLGWLMAGSVKGLNRARKKWNVRAVCAVGMGTPEMGQGEELARKLPGLPVFYLQGGYAPEKLTGVNKVMMGFMAKAMSKKPPKDEKEAEMQAAFRDGCDFVDGANLAPVLAWLAERE